eukprot:6480609-Amphidinium_carterae.2
MCRKASRHQHRRNGLRPATRYVCALPDGNTRRIFTDVRTCEQATSDTSKILAVLDSQTLRKQPMLAITCRSLTSTQRFLQPATSAWSWCGD